MHIGIAGVVHERNLFSKTINYKILFQILIIFKLTRNVKYDFLLFNILLYLIVFVMLPQMCV